MCEKKIKSKIGKNLLEKGTKIVSEKKKKILYSQRSLTFSEKAKHL